MSATLAASAYAGSAYAVTAYGGDVAPQVVTYLAANVWSAGHPEFLSGQGARSVEVVNGVLATVLTVETTTPAGVSRQIKTWLPLTGS